MKRGFDVLKCNTVALKEHVGRWAELHWLASKTVQNIRHYGETSGPREGDGNSCLRET